MATVVREPSRTAGPRIRPAGRGGTRRTTRAATRAGRRLAVLALLVIAVAVILVFGRVPATAARPVPTAESSGQTLVVAPGQTVWDLVLPHTPAGQDPAVYVARVVEANGLDALRVAPGTVVRLP